MNETARLYLPGLGGVIVSLDIQGRGSGVLGLGTFLPLTGPVLFAATVATAALLHLRTGVGTVVELSLGVALPLLLGVTGTSGFLALDGVSALLTGCAVEMLLLFPLALFALTGVVNDFDRCTLLGVWGLLYPCSVEFVLLCRCPGVLPSALLDLGVGGAFLLLIPGCASALTGWGRPLGLVNLGFDSALAPFTGFKLAFVAGTLRAQTVGIDDISEEEPLEITKVSLRSFD